MLTLYRAIYKYRQRIEKTSSILGVDFAVHNIPRTSYDNDEEDSLDLFNPALFDGESIWKIFNVLASYVEDYV
jgi:hypothetical protein